MDYSDILSSGVTLIVGGIAWLVYYLQQKQLDKDAATLVYLQLREAERRISELQQQPAQELVVSSLTKPIIGQNNWDQSKSRLVKHFDTDEIELINSFYIRVSSAELARTECKKIFDESLAEKARNIQVKLIDNIYQNLDNEVTRQSNRDKLINLVNSESFVFEPTAPKERAFKELLHISFITTTPTGHKLKKLSKISK